MSSAESAEPNLSREAPSRDAPSRLAPKRKSGPKFRLHQLLRWLHTYVSLFSLLVLVFFALTGITLNHPEWTFGMEERSRTEKGTLPAGMIIDGKPNWLQVAEELRAKHHLRGRVKDERVDAGEGSLAFRGPGYAADAFFSIENGEYEVSVTDQGPVGLMNDLHRGRDAGPGWSLLVDLSGAFLTFVSLTGLGILFYLKKSRVAGFALAAVGAVVLVILAQIALR